MSETSASEFWSELPDVLAQAEQLDDAAAASVLVEFLEAYRHAWTAIAASIHASAGRRALFERGVLILAERDMVDDRLPD
jgi:hypothetical protein